MEKLVTGAAVFLAVVFGQPDLLATLCLYLFAVILSGIAAVTLLRTIKSA